MAIKTVQFLRNQDVISGYEAAVATLKGKWAELSDGSPIVIRYTEEEGEGEDLKVVSKALFAIKDTNSEVDTPFVILDSNAQIEALEAKLAALEETIAEELGENGSVAEAIAKLKEELLGDATDGYKSLGDVEDKIKAVAEAAKSYSMVAIAEEKFEELGLGANVKEAFHLVDEDGAQAGDIIKVYKDSALVAVKLSTVDATWDETNKQIVSGTGEVALAYAYADVEGKIQVVTINVSEFLAESEFKDGLQVNENGEVSVKLAEDIADKDGVVTKKNFIEFEEEGDKKAIALRSIDTDATVLQKEIVVAGLSDQFGAGNYENNDVIAAGTDIYTILQNILCKELYPQSVSSSTLAYSASMSKLTLTLDKSSTQEVGTLVNMTVGKTNGSSESKTSDSSVYGMEYGYSSADNDTKESANASIVATPSCEVSDNTYTISATLTGFNADNTTYVQTVPTTVTGDGSASLNATALGCLVEGDNKITINATGASYAYSCDAIDAVYYCSNLGNTDAAKVSPSVDAVDTTTSKPTKTESATVTAKYKYFLGYSSATTYNELDSTAVRALTTKSTWVTKDGTTTIVNADPITSNGKSIVIACPDKYKLATIQNGVGANIIENFTTKGSEGTVDVKTGEIMTSYKVYVYPITNGATVEFKNVTLTLKNA